MTIITNVQPAPLDMRGIDPHAIYREARPAAVNHQAAKPAQPGPAVLVLNTPKRDEFAGYSVNAAIDEALGVPSKPLASQQQAVNAGLGEFAGYSINATNAAAALPAQPKPATTGDDFAGYSINSHMTP